MRKASKWLVLLVALAMAVSVFAVAGCSSNQNQGGTGGGSTEASGTAEQPKLVTPGQITVGSDTSFPPFESLNGANAEGFDVDLVAAIAKAEGLTSVFKTETFDTLIPTLKAGGKFDLIASAMTITDERKQEIDFSDPYIDSNQSLAVKKGSPIKTLADLKGKKVGVQSGTTGEALAKEKAAGATLVPFKTATDAFAALQAGNVDGVVNDLPVTAFLVKDAARGLVIAEEIPTGEQYGYGISKDNPGLLKAVNDGLKKVKESGEYDTIYKKWFGTAPTSSSGSTTTP
jgi:polar amino acid transport system substrate-binding protein